MLSGLAQASITILVILLFYAMDFILIRRYDKTRAAGGSGRAWDFTLFIFIAVAVLVLQPIFLPILSFHIMEPIGSFLQIFSIVLLIESLLLHAWSRAHLGKYYAERVEVQPDHKVIDSGPYKLMRHPVITSFFGIAAGLFFVNPAITTLAAFAYTIWDFTRAAKQEENLLAKSLPGYADYASRTPRFLPRLWRHS